MNTRIETKRVRITNRKETCRCGPACRDPWHAASFVRSVRSVTIHEEPVVTYEGSERFGLPAIHEVARGEAKFPSGTVTVRCLVRVRDGVPSTFSDWERVE